MNFIKRHFAKNKNKYLNISLTLFVTVITLEIGSLISLKIIKKDGINSFTESNKCTYFQMLMPHPYLGYVNGPRMTCEKNIDRVNELGFVGDQMPPIRSEKNFFIMVTGGSVAQNVANYPLTFADGRQTASYSFLGEYLNKCYLPPKPFKGFKISTTAMGGWVQPQNTISTLLFADRVHGIITLDGFNEHYQLNTPYLAMGIPSNNFAYLMKLRFTGNFLLDNLVSLISDIAILKYENPILKRSKTLDLIMAIANKYTIKLNPNINPQRFKEYGDFKVSYAGQWALPSNWSTQEKAEYNYTQYKKFLKQTDAIGKISKTNTTFFLQPVPVMHKKLTDFEKKVTKHKEYKNSYLRLEKEFLSLKEEGLDVNSLTKIYDNTNETIYSDPIHAVVKPKSEYTLESLGYEIMAKEITDKVAISWGFTKKDNDLCY